MASAFDLWRKAGHSIALVPTMGGLHGGHLSLVAAALTTHDKVVVSIYVNPTQFAKHEDLADYPRTMTEDEAALSRFGDRVSIFAPDSLYHEDHATMIVPQGAALPLEGAHRPHFFTGVATVVFKLFQAVPADSAFFGEKDYQQLAVIRQMVRDLSLPIVILKVPTMRNASGLALSSRNRYLTEEQSAIAPQLYREMRACAQVVAGGLAWQDACDGAKDRLIAAGFASVDYFMFCEADSLAPATVVTDSSRLLVAVWLGKTRLIDNESYRLLCIAQ